MFALALLLDAHVFAFLGCFGGRLLVSWICVYRLKQDYCQGEGCFKPTFDALFMGSV